MAEGEQLVCKLKVPHTSAVLAKYGSITKCSVLLYNQLSPPGLHSIRIKFQLVSVYQLGYKMQMCYSVITLVDRMRDTV